MRFDDERLFAYCMCTEPECQSAMGVMEVVGRADGEIVYSFALSTEKLEVAIEALDVREECCVVWGVSIEHADRVVWITGGDELIAGFLNGSHMSWRDVSGGSGNCKAKWHG